jgi:2'-5' RNA ligase
MPYAINVRSDHASASQITDLWRAAGKLEEEPSMEVLDYPPHLTLAIYDEIASALVIEAIDEVFAEFEPCTVRFERLGMFETRDSLVLWAEPSIPPEMRLAHENIHRRIDPRLCRPNYRSGIWVPHCSLATSIALERKTEAVAFVTRSIEPVEVVFDVSDCASFLPVKVLHEVFFGPAS